MTKIDLLNAEVVGWAKEYAEKIKRGEAEPFHALICDPPYHLYEPRSSLNTFCERGTNGKHTGRSERDKELRRGGFMGKNWDGGDVTFNPKTWAAFKEVLYDGAFIMAFASSRGWHRMAVAIEDAGFVFHPSIFMYGFSYGSGFPKATRIDSQIDKLNNVESETELAQGRWSDSGSDMYQCSTGTQYGVGQYEKKLPTSDLAKIWAGHRYGLQALKPALEPVIVAQKPYRGKSIESITRTGAGALNIDGTRIGTETIVTKSKGLASAAHEGRKRPYHETAETQTFVANGRWASNLILLHHPDCKRIGTKRVKGAGWRDSDKSGPSLFVSCNVVGTRHFTDADGMETVDAWECHESCAVKALGEMSGNSKSVSHRHNHKQETQIFGNGHGLGIRDGHSEFNDTGTAARFFFNADWNAEVEERLIESSPVFYTSKASRKERDAGLDRFPVQVGKGALAGNEDGSLNKRTNGKPTEGRNIHPTIKPLSLVTYLSKILLPPDAYTPRRVFIPFAGSGSEMIGAMQAGWDEIVGVEITEEYIPIAQARIEYWQNHKDQAVKSKRNKPKIKKEKQEKPLPKTQEQTELFPSV